MCPRVCPLHMFAHVCAACAVTRSDIRSDSLVCGQGTYARVAPRSGLAVKKMTLGCSVGM